MEIKHLVLGFALVYAVMLLAYAVVRFMYYLKSKNQPDG